MRVLSESVVLTVLKSLSAQDVERLSQDMGKALASCLPQDSNPNNANTVHLPQRTVVTIPDQSAVLVMPVATQARTAVKVVTVPKKGSIQGAVSVFAADGQLQGLVHASELTAFRTALCSMTMFRRWKTGDETHLVVFGAGKQVEWHVRLAMLLMPKLKNIAVINRGRERLTHLHQGCFAELRYSHSDIDITTISMEGNDQYDQNVQSHLGSADVIFCCTPSTEPLLTADDLEQPSKRRFLSLVGSYKPEMQEISTDVLQLSQNIWVDSRSACMEEAGELIRAGMKGEELRELSELYRDSSNNEATGGNEGLTIFKCVGSGIMDLVAAEALLDLAQTKNVGVDMDF